MADAFHLAPRDLPAPYIEATVYLAGIRGNDLALEASRKRDGEIALARGRRADYHDHPMSLHPAQRTIRRMNKKLTIYYDGVCNLCAGLADDLAASSQKDRFDMRDISEGTLPQGVSHDEAMHDVHVEDEGTMYRGADAVLRILGTYPRWRLLARLGMWPGFHLVAVLLYRAVEKTRYSFFGRRK